MCVSLLCTTVAGAQLVLRDVSGTVEQQRTTWQTARSGDNVTQALRTGTGRATFQNGASAQVLMGSSSALELYQNEPNFMSGNFYLQGEGKFYVQGVHYFNSGKVRVDLRGNEQRIAVIDGSLRIAVGTQVSTLNSGLQYNLKTLKVSPFTESDPWYLARFVGAGNAQIEAVSGTVILQNTDGSSHTVQPVEELRPGQTLSTFDKSWAEISFSGGGYLRLQPQSALSVLSIEKTSRGREVQLKLLRGSAWNVVAKGKGGYQITTPTVTTAVRGTQFRVDSSGLVKVFEGQVVLPTSGDLPLSQGQQISPSGELTPLQIDQSDLDNQALDAAHNAPLLLSVDWPSGPQPYAQQQLDLTIHSQPTSQIIATLTPQGSRSLPPILLRPTTPSTVPQAVFRLQGDLPEGHYHVDILAKRFGKTRNIKGHMVIDRKPPTFGKLRVIRRGRMLRIMGSLSDQLPVTVQITVQSGDGGQRQYTQHLNPAQASLVNKATPFEWVFAAQSAAQDTVTLLATDQAGNQSKASDDKLQR